MREYRQGPGGLILYRHTLLGAGLCALLSREGIKSVARRANRRGLAKSLRGNPPVVIVEDGGKGFAQLLADVLALDDPALVVRVSLADNRMLYYQGRQAEASKADLTRLVLGALNDRAQDQDGQPSCPTVVSHFWETNTAPEGYQTWIQER